MTLFIALLLKQLHFLFAVIALIFDKFNFLTAQGLCIMNV